MSALGRFKQGIRGFRPPRPADYNAILSQALTKDQQNAFARLPAYDQSHLCAVYRWLVAEDVTDRDLLVAGLLHDLGKAALCGRVRLIDRTVSVLLESTAPRVLVRLARLPSPKWRLGLALTVHHPRLGAEWAARLGCSERTCWLIEHHADNPPPPDPDLALLIRADRIV